MILWPWLLGGGAAAAAAAYAFMNKKGAAAQLPPYTPPTPSPVPSPVPTPVTPRYIAPLPVPPTPQPVQVLPMPPQPVPITPQTTPYRPVSPDSNLSTVPTIYQAQQGQPGPSGTPYSFATMEVTTERDPLNLRSSPNGSVIGTMPKGSKFMVDKIEGGWAHGKSASSGQIGWASTQYLGGAGATTETFSSQPYGTESFSSGISGAAKGSIYVEGFRNAIRQTMARR